MERLRRRHSMAYDQFSMTNSQSTLAGSDAFRNGLAPKFSTQSHQIAPNRTKKNVLMAKKSQFNLLDLGGAPCARSVLECGTAVPLSETKANQSNPGGRRVVNRGSGCVNFTPPPARSKLIKGCASEVGRNVGESPTRRVRLFTTEHDLNSVAARRGWKLRKMNRRAVTKVNHI